MFLQDGTINYLNLPAVTEGLRFLSAYLPFLPLRLSTLTHHLVTSLSQLRHESSGTPVVRVLSRVPTNRVKTIGGQSDCGSTVSFIFLAVSTPLLITENRSFRANDHDFPASLAWFGFLIPDTSISLIVDL